MMWGRVWIDTVVTQVGSLGVEIGASVVCGLRGLSTLIGRGGEGQDHMYNKVCVSDIVKACVVDIVFCSKRTRNSRWVIKTAQLACQKVSLSFFVSVYKTGYFLFV